jgi:hypothetical protein
MEIRDGDWAGAGEKIYITLKNKQTYLWTTRFTPHVNSTAGYGFEGPNVPHLVRETLGSNEYALKVLNGGVEVDYENATFVLEGGGIFYENPILGFQDGLIPSGLNSF